MRDKRSAIDIISELMHGVPYIEQTDESKKDILNDIQEKKEELKNGLRKDV